MINDSQQLPRKERERLARRQLILDAALKVFAYRGFTDTKLDDVAELAEFGKATLYSYFSTKEALFESVLEEAFSTFKAIAVTTFATDEPFDQQLRRFIHEELEYFYTNPESLHMMMSEAHHLRGANPMLRLMPEVLTILTTAIGREQQQGRMMPGTDPMSLALMLLNMLFSQFMARAYRLIQAEGAEKVMQDEKSMQAFIQRLRTTDLQQEVASATALIYTVYLNGTRQ